MNMATIKNWLLPAILVLFLIPVITSSVLDLRAERLAEEARQREAAELEAKRLAEKKDYLMGKFEPAERTDFVLVPKEFTTLPNDMYLRKEAWAAFQEMQAAAALQDVDLKIASATRNFNYQRYIWENKWLGTTLVDGAKLSESMPDGFERFIKILEYSAAPGASRHHWGTDVDIFYAIPSFFENGKGKIIYDWLTANAPRFGFCQTYNAKGADRLTGFNEEKWHWSYLPLARQYTEEYKTLIKPADITGFLGAEYAPANLIEGYVLGLNPECI